MKLQTLFEAYEPPILTPQEIAALQEPSPQNIAKTYRVGKVAFDNVHGMGAVPLNQDVGYLGFAMSITPRDFASLALYGNRLHTAQKMIESMKKGTPLGAPFLKVDINYREYKAGKPLQVQITGHEGRARMVATEMLNGRASLIPVHVIPSYLRARDFDAQFFKDLRDTGVLPEGSFEGSKPFKLNIGPIFWNGQTV